MAGGSLGDDASGIEVLDPEDALGVGMGRDILIVDDHVNNLVAYEAALAPLGRQVVLAMSGMEALGKLLEQDFALVLLDVAMPGMDGLETARLIRERPRNRNVPIIFITGMESPNDVIVEAYAAGAFDFVIKPVLPEVLRAKARVYLQLQERTQALLQQTIRLREAQTAIDAGEQAQRDRAATLAIAHRLEKLQETTAALAEARTPSEIAGVTVRLGAEAVDAHSSAMWIAQPDGTLLLDASYNVPPEYLEQWRVIPPDSSLLGMRVLQRRQPVWVESEADYQREAPKIIETARAAQRVWSFAALPLCSKERALALVTFSYRGSHRFSPDERRFLSALARVAEQALERAQLYVREAEARRQAEAVSQRKDEFLAMLGHELRNPLAAMVSALDLVKLREAKLDRELSIIDRQLGQLTQIVGDLVDVSRITQGKIALRREAVALRDAIANAIEIARPWIDRHEHDVAVGISQPLIVDADRLRLIQVLANMITNAAQYTPSRGRIEIRAHAAGTHAHIEVRDNGRGIPAALLPHVFDLFVQGERTPDRREGGLGIGLTLARSVVELHGGSVEAHSEGLDQGSTFVLRWPLETPRTSTARIKALSRPVAERSIRVLIVDDNIDTADMLAAVMRSIGHEVMLANDSATALDRASEFQPQIALLDIGLPEVDGYELASRLRALPGLEHLTLIAVTGYGQPEDRERSRRAGFAHHLVKPVDLATLRELLQPHDEAEPTA